MKLKFKPETSYIENVAAKACGRGVKSINYSYFTAKSISVDFTIK